MSIQIDDSILAIFSDHQDSMAYMSLNEVLDKYNIYKTFNAYAGNIHHTEMNYNFSNINYTIPSIEASIYNKNTIFIGSFTHSKYDNYLMYGSYDKIYGCIVGTIRNKENFLSKYGFTDDESISDSEYIVKAYRMCRNSINNCKSQSVTSFLEFIDGDFSIFLIDYQYHIAFVYSRNFPLYIMNGSSDKMVFTNKEYNLNSVNGVNKFTLLPNNIGYVISFKYDSPTIIESFKCKYVSLTTNKQRCLMASYNVKNVYAINNIENIFEPSMYMVPNIDIKCVSNRLLKKFNPISLDNITSEKLKLHDFSLHVIDECIKNRYGSILVPNMNNEDYLFIKILKNIIDSLNIIIYVYPLYTNLTNDIFASDYYIKPKEYRKAYLDTNIKLNNNDPDYYKWFAILLE